MMYIWLKVIWFRYNRKKHLQLVNFTQTSYDETGHGMSTCDFARVIHARCANGNTITGVEVFRAMWEAIGLRWHARLSRQATITQWLLRAYAWFAKNRLRLTRRAE
ncbi:DCC1-like thiol-disulfide oxidoreductase family protein [Nitrospira sp. M1]